MSTLELELAVENLRHVLSRMPPLSAASGTEVLTACARHRQLACGLWLSDLDAAGFRAELRLSAEAHLSLLEPRHQGDPYSRCASRAKPLLDALALGDLALARQVALHVAPKWEPRMEPKAEFAFFRAVADLVLSTPSGAMEMLGFSSRADALSAIVANEPRDFEKALESVVADWKDEVEAQRRRDALDAYAAATDGYVCIEGLALVHLARSRGLSLDEWVRYVPAELCPR